MKKTNLFLLSALFIFLPALLPATDWDKPDHGYFDYQKDIDGSMASSDTRTMASINYNGQIFNFVNWSGVNWKIEDYSRLILRKLTNDGTKNLKWSFEKQDDITHLNDLGVYDWQPAPVIFNEQLYVFVGNKTSDDNIYAGGISYSEYNSGADTWSSLNKVTSSKLGEGMAAVVINNMLCLIYRDSDSEIHILSTPDLLDWHTEKISDSFKSTKHQQIAAIASSYRLNGKKIDKLFFAIIDDDENAKSYEYYYDSKSTGQKWVLIAKKTVSDDHNFQSVALAEGTVTGDPSTGKCVQAFLKLNSQDNGYCRYRIQRYQLKDNAKDWTKQENNLLPQTSPKRLWASKDVNLTAINFPVSDTTLPNGKDIRQYMCLFYRGYDDIDWPLNSAWVETDRMVYDPSREMSQTMGGPENTSYIGYIEGPPPYYLNKLPLEDPYLNPNANDISSLEFTTSTTTSTENETSYDVKAELNFKAGFFKAGLSTSFGQAWGKGYSQKLSHSVDIYAQEEARGFYITISPTINRAFYHVFDVHNNILDSTFYFYMTEPVFSLEKVELQNGLNPANPDTYMKRSGINFASYANSRYGTITNSWTGGAHVSDGISIEQSETQSNKLETTLTLGAELGEMFDIGVESSFDYSLKTTTSTGNEVMSASRLNEPLNPGDVTQLNYTTHWIKPNFSTGMNNWWLHKGAEKQNTWCVTYEVTSVQYKKNKIPDSDKDTLTNEKPNQANAEITRIEANGSGNNEGQKSGSFESSSSYSLSQNTPNPFNSSTRIKYSIAEGVDHNAYLTRLIVHDIYGKEVAVLVNEFQNPGIYEVNWNVSQISPGVYFYRLQNGSFSEMKKLIISK